MSSGYVDLERGSDLRVPRRKGIENPCEWIRAFRENVEHEERAGRRRGRECQHAKGCRGPFIERADPVVEG